MDQISFPGRRVGSEREPLFGKVEAGIDPGTIAAYVESSPRSIHVSRDQTVQDQLVLIPEQLVAQTRWDFRAPQQIRHSDEAHDVVATLRASDVAGHGLSPTDRE